MKPKILQVNGSTPYPIYMGHNLLNTDLFPDFCQQLNKRLVIITDSHLVYSLGKKLQAQLQQQGHHAELISFPAGEQNKTRETKHNLEDILLAKHYGRDTCLIALGGGVVTDLVGFVAATYCRGIPVIYVPTTLLAMIDASIGGKTAVNAAYGKNLIGTFCQPHAVFIDTQTLNSLPEKELMNGMVEMIKHSLIADVNIFTLLKTHVDKIKNRDIDFLNDMIYASCLIKKNIVEQDEKEYGLRQVLNFGHTIGHALETVENYKISHAEAVAIGMIVEGYLSVQCGFLEESDFNAIRDILHCYALPLQTNGFQEKNALLNALMMDKKSLQSKSHFVLLDAIGKPHLQNSSRYSMPIDLTLLNQALEWAADNFSSRST